MFRKKSGEKELDLSPIDLDRQRKRKEGGHHRLNHETASAGVEVGVNGGRVEHKGQCQQKDELGRGFPGFHGSMLIIIPFLMRSWQPSDSREKVPLVPDSQDSGGTHLAGHADVFPLGIRAFEPDHPAIISVTRSGSGTTATRKIAKSTPSIGSDRRTTKNSAFSDQRSKIGWATAKLESTQRCRAVVPGNLLSEASVSSSR